MTAVIALLFALIVDRLVGWPDWLYTRFSHPVVAIGHLITLHDNHLNKSHFSDLKRRLMGIITVIIVCSVCVTIAIMPSFFYQNTLFDTILIALLAWPFIAAKSLKDHVQCVAKPLSQTDSDSARKAVAMIVGRNAQRLNEAGLARASLESLAENTSDGVIAPLFWGALLGLPGLVLYKAINTMDSMIGYRSEKYKAFGWVAARLDDVVNFIPARITALFYVMCSERPFYCLKIAARDASKHRSPNAGWPESALAASLDIRLSGPRIYDGVLSQDAWLHEEGGDPNADDIINGIRHYDFLLNLVIITVIVALSIVFLKNLW